MDVGGANPVPSPGRERQLPSRRSMRLRYGNGYGAFRRLALIAGRRFSRRRASLAESGTAGQPMRSTLLSPPGRSLRGRREEPGLAKHLAVAQLEQHHVESRRAICVGHRSGNPPEVPRPDHRLDSERGRHDPPILCADDAANMGAQPTSGPVVSDATRGRPARAGGRPGGRPSARDPQQPRPLHRPPRCPTARATGPRPSSRRAGGSR